MKNSLPEQPITNLPQGTDIKRYSVLYLLQEQYCHTGCITYLQAQALLEGMSAETGQTPVGIYDAKTELFEWEPDRKLLYNQASIGEQGKRAEEMIRIVQELRLHDSNNQ
ncbi:hypothetical protein [Telluribacter sp. SYSU D00476]|uniref:hypothetical protein n=1 Tax=Telluribacter sp. SYSU D00476 TaxID=2811430 RepID=UPI001FF0FD4E|nr:hypothetical protein [Telluribacter sp. SYSU D00476]